MASMLLGGRGPGGLRQPGVDIRYGWGTGAGVPEGVGFVSFRKRRDARHHLVHRALFARPILAGGLLLVLAWAGCGNGGATAPSLPAARLSLSSVDAPESISVELYGETETLFYLSHSVQATYVHSATSPIVELSGAELQRGVYALTIAGVEPGETTVTVSATAPGYQTATAEIAVVVEEPFRPQLWRELVFDAFDCPSGAAGIFTSCGQQWGGRNVEQRATAVLSSQPKFRIVTNAWTPQGGILPWKFTEEDVAVIQHAISDAVWQLTGEEFVGRLWIDYEMHLDEPGWVQIVPAGPEWIQPEDSTGPLACGLAYVGRPAGLALIDVTRRDDCDLATVVMHEIGHLLGFWHVPDEGDHLMSPNRREFERAAFSEAEQYHAKLAWELGRGANFTPDPRTRQTGFSMTSLYRPHGSDVGAVPFEGMVVCRY